MKILLVAEFGPGDLGSSYARAFRQAGTELHCFESRALASHVRVVRRLLQPYRHRLLTERLQTAARQFHPDLIFVIKGAFLSAASIETMRRDTGALIFNFNPDTPFNLHPGASNDRIRGAISHYDCYLIWGRFLMPQLRQAGARRVEYLPFARDPELHTPFEGDIDGRERVDIAFIGSWERERERWLEPLVSRRLAIWGSAWDRVRRGSPLRRCWTGQEAVGEAFSRVCARSRVVLNLLREQNGNAHNMRTFEVPACRGFMLTTRSEGQSELFEEGAHIGCFATPEELQRKVAWYVERPDETSRMARAAHEQVQSHTYQARAGAILGFYDAMRHSASIR
ncbi:MAG: CgeB family protein [Candidatus Xenobia bacterium]